MAEETLGKTVDQLKKERTSAKNNFTKQANFLCREAHRLLESELKEEFRKLASEARKLFDTNDDYKAGLLAEVEAQQEDGDEVLLSVQQEAGLKRIEEECNARFREVNELVQNNLWKRYGQDEVSSTLSAAETAYERAVTLPVDAVGYGVQLELSVRLVKEAFEALVNWERWTPTTERAQLKGHVRKLKEFSNEFEARKVEFAWARRVAEIARESKIDMKNMLDVTASAAQIMPVVRYNTSLPKFSGNNRDFYRWKRDWEYLQRRGEPTGSPEVKKIQLLDSIDDKIAKELRLFSYNTAADIFRVLESRYGNKTTIAMEIVEELERIPAVRGNQPRRTLELIQMVEKALADLMDLGNISAIKNPLVTKSIESKLPEFMKRDWLVYMMDPANGITPENHFDALLKFLKNQEDILEKLEQLKISEKEEKPQKKSGRYTFTRMTKKVPPESGCVVCGAEKHRDKIFLCKKFKELKLAEKKSIVKELGACKKCLVCHKDGDRCNDNFLCRHRDCKMGDWSDHHYFLCPKWSSRTWQTDR